MNIFKRFFLGLVLFFLPLTALAVSPPSGLAVGSINNDNSCLLSWNEDTSVNQWLVFLGGNLTYQPFRDQTDFISSTNQRRFLMTGLPRQASIVISMQAIAPGQPTSGMSSAVTLTPLSTSKTFSYIAANAVSAASTAFMIALTRTPGIQPTIIFDNSSGEGSLFWGWVTSIAVPANTLAGQRRAVTSGQTFLANPPTSVTGAWYYWSAALLTTPTVEVDQ